MTAPAKFPWTSLPSDLRHLILSHVPLDELLCSTQSLFPLTAPSLLDARIRALRPLWRAWLDSPITVRNPPPFRTRLARRLCTPAEFVRLPRLVLGGTRLAGTLTPAVAELGPHLRVLHLDDNALTALPPALRRCRNLQLLDCSANRFEELPCVVLDLPDLQYLSFAQNPRLRAIPPHVADMPTVKALSFFMCALTHIPQRVVDKAVATADFSLNVSGNCFPRRYLITICDRFPAFKSKLTHVMVQ